MNSYEVVNKEGVVLGRLNIELENPSAASELLAAIAAKWNLPRASLRIREVKKCLGTLN